MSSIPKSSPHTPLRRSMAVERQTRTPLPNDTISEKSNGFVAAALETFEKPGDVVQVPSTSPPVDDNTVTKQNQSQNGLNGHSQAVEDHDEPMSTADLDASELRPFNWEDFRRRNQEELQKLDDDEESLGEDFEKLAQVSTECCYSII
jgi:hypothetical protein